MPRIISSTTTSDDYNYDFPMPPTSSLINPPSLPTRKPAHVLRRPRSPSPTYLTPHFPTSHHSSKYVPSTRAAEVSRLLDPAYANPSHQGSGSTSSNSPLSVFVDHYGDLHDPEYRHFPVVATRPKWEQGEQGDDDLDEDEDVFGARIYSFSRKPPITPYRPSYAYTSYHYDVPHPSPSSYDSNALANEDLEGSPFVDELNEKKETKCSARIARRRQSKSSHSHTAEEKESLAALGNEGTEKSNSASGTDHVPRERGDHDWTPTCTQSLRREWQAITLNLRFSLFRMKRKVKRRLGTG